MDTTVRTCGARADEVGGPDHWMCSLTLGHSRELMHATSGGEVWSEHTFAAECAGGAQPGESGAGGRQRPCPEHDRADELETAALVGEATDIDGSPGDLLDSDPPARETPSDMLRAVADALEQLPRPFGLTVRFDGGTGRAEAWFHERGDMEQWRVWVGAAPVATPQWEASSTGGVLRRWRTSVMWGRHEVELTWPEHRSEPETPAERRDRLAAEVAEIDRQLAAGGEPA